MTPSRAISIALIPPVVAAAVFAALVWEFEHGSLLHQLIVWSIAMICSGGMQMLYVMNLRREKKVADYDVPDRLKRTKPYLFSSGISLLGMLGLLMLDASFFVWSLMWCFTVNTLILTAINLRWKISAHMMGLTGPALYLIPVFGLWTLLLLPVAGVLGWARIREGAHDLPQVLAGAAAGVLLTAMQAWTALVLVLPALS